MLALLDRERTVAGPGFNRWLVPPAALAVHLSIGQVYAFSVFNAPLEAQVRRQRHRHRHHLLDRHRHARACRPPSAGPGSSATAPARPWRCRRRCWSVGFLVAALGIASGQLWLVYLGYGVLGGIGLGIGYISPVSTLIKWFPDRPGLATGLAIMGFGGGALVASPLSNRLLGLYARRAAPTRWCPCSSPSASPTLVLMSLGAYVVRVPSPDWKPRGLDPARRLRHQLDADHRERQCEARPPHAAVLAAVDGAVLQRHRRHRHPRPGLAHGAGLLLLGRPAEAAGYVGLLSLANMAGRLVWSSTSDVIGRKNTYVMYLGVGAAAVPVRRAVRHAVAAGVRAADGASSSASTAAGSPRSRPTSRTCSAGTRSAPSTAGC